MTSFLLVLEADVDVNTTIRSCDLELLCGVESSFDASIRGVELDMFGSESL